MYDLKGVHWKREKEWSNEQGRDVQMVPHPSGTAGKSSGVKDSIKSLWWQEWGFCRDGKYDGRGGDWE